MEPSTTAAATVIRLLIVDSLPIDAGSSSRRTDLKQEHVRARSHNLYSCCWRRGCERSKRSPRKVLRRRGATTAPQPTRRVEAHRRGRARDRRRVGHTTTRLPTHPRRAVPRRIRRQGRHAPHQAERGVRALVEAEVGTLRLGASGTPGTYLVPKVVRRFIDRRPYVDVRSNSARPPKRSTPSNTTRSSWASLAASVVDPISTSNRSLTTTWCSSAHHHSSRPGSGQETSMTCSGCTVRKAPQHERAQAALRAIGAAPRRRLAVPSWEAIKLVVADGGAVAAVSQMAIDVEQAAGTLVQLDVNGWRLGRPISIARHPQLPLSPLATAFVADLRQQAQRLPDRTSSPAIGRAERPSGGPSGGRCRRRCRGEPSTGARRA